MTTFAIDVRTVRDFDEFIAAVNRDFIGQVGGAWDGNLDALHDYPSWPSASSYTLKFVGSAECAAALGLDEHAAWIRRALERCHPTNREGLLGSLEDAESGRGPTLFDVILETVRDNECVRIELR